MRKNVKEGVVLCATPFVLLVLLFNPVVGAVLMVGLALLLSWMK